MSTSQLFASEQPYTSEKVNEVVKDTEGNQYRTVTIGKQVWLAENLRSTKFQNGSSVSSAFIPEDKPENLLPYGRLYSWEDVAAERNICPAGWRVASDTDWQRLESTIGIAKNELAEHGWRGDNDIANTLKAKQANSVLRQFDQSQVNKYWFSAQPAGVKWHNWYVAQGAYSEFWTATSATEKQAYARTLAYSWWNPNRGKIRRTTLNKNDMFSVRCVKI